MQCICCGISQEGGGSKMDAEEILNLLKYGENISLECKKAERRYGYSDDYREHDGDQNPDEHRAGEVLPARVITREGGDKAHDESDDRDREEKHHPEVVRRADRLDRGRR